MKQRRRCKFHCAASVLIFLFGAVSGIGGIVDLIYKTDLLIRIDISSTTLLLLTILLIILSAATVIIAYNVYEQNKNSILFGILLSAIFVINSFANGNILFGDTISYAVITNVIASIIIMSLLILGRRSLRKFEKLQNTIKLNNHPTLMHGSLSH